MNKQIIGVKFHIVKKMLQKNKRSLALILSYWLREMCINLHLV